MFSAERSARAATTHRPARRMTTTRAAGLHATKETSEAAGLKEMSCWCWRWPDWATAIVNLRERLSARSTRGSQGPSLREGGGDSRYVDHGAVAERRRTMGVSPWSSQGGDNRKDEGRPALLDAVSRTSSLACCPAPETASLTKDFSLAPKSDTFPGTQVSIDTIDVKITTPTWAAAQLSRCQSSSLVSQPPRWKPPGS